MEFRLTRGWWVWLAVCLAWAGCSGVQHRVIPPGTPLEELPASFSIVIGRAEMRSGGTPLPCRPIGEVCSLVVRDAGGGSFAIPYTDPANSWLPGARGAPFFVVRLPAGDYTLDHLLLTEVDGKTKSGRGLRLGGKVKIGKRFEVGKREVLYIGTLLLEMPPGRAGKPVIRVVDEGSAAADIGRSVQGDVKQPLVTVTRLME